MEESGVELQNEQPEDHMEDENDQEEEPPRKKARVFNIKQFRDNLYTENRDFYLKEMLNLCKNNDVKSIQEFIETGGFGLELVHFLDKPNSPNAIIMEVVAAALFIIASGLQQHMSLAIKVAQYILDTHINLLNKMLGTNSTVTQRRASFTLLTAIIPLSSKLAKDVLIHVDLNPKIIEILTENVLQKETLRNMYVRFLAGFAAHDHYPTIAALLEKRHLITSFTRNLRYDVADTVYNTFRFLTVDVVGNPAVSKTVKMKVFNTGVLTDVLHVYNWKGPGGFDHATKKENLDVKVDPVDKAKVLKGVHKFMMHLCTMPKYGIIFKDPQLGLGKKSKNRILYKVLDVLESPWCNQLAQQLTIKICAACPDLTKYLWSLIKECFYPRPNERAKIVEFVEHLVSEVGPDQVMFAVKELSTGQLAAITQILSAPTSVIEVLLGGDGNLETRCQVLGMLSCMLKGVKRFLVTFEGVLNEKQFLYYRKCLVDYVKKNFPNVDHQILNCGDLNKETAVESLSSIFDVLKLYDELCPEHLENLSKINLNKLLKLLKEGSDTEELQIKFINLFLKYDREQFSSQTKQFPRIVKFLTQNYHRSKNLEAFEALSKLFENSGLFEKSQYEIPIWVNSLTNINNCTEEVTSLFVSILQKGRENSEIYTKKLSKIVAKCGDIDITNNVILSPAIFTLFDCLDNQEEIGNYVDYLLLNLLHNQTEPKVLLTILKKHKINASDDVLKYIFGFENEEDDNILIISDSPDDRKNLKSLSEFSKSFVQNLLTVETLKQFEDDNLKEALFKMSLFYITNFVGYNKLTSVHTTNFELCLKQWNNEEYIKTLIENPKLLRYFQPLKLDKQDTSFGLCTMFITNIVKENTINESLLKPYQSKLFDSVLKLPKKSKYKNLETAKILDVVKSFKLNLEQSFEFLNSRTELTNFINDNQELSIIYQLYSYSLHRLTELSKNYDTDLILNEESIKYFVDVLNSIITDRHFNIDTFMKPLNSYLNLYPHLIKSIEDGFFISILKEQFSIDYSNFVCLLLQTNFDKFVNILLDTIKELTLTKGMMLPILDICVSNNLDTERLRILYDKFESVIFKTLEKPHKAGEHFQKHYTGLSKLIKLFFPEFKCKTFIEKVHEFNISEPFFIHLIKVIYQKSFIADVTEKQASNAILTFVNCFLHSFKQPRESYIELTSCFIEILTTIHEKNLTFVETSKNKNFKSFVEASMDLGISGQACLLNLLRKIVEVGMLEGELKLLVDAILNHGKFYDLILGKDSAEKMECVALIYEIYQKSPQVMEKSHIPIALAAYGATTRKTDRIALAILRLFEKKMMSEFHEFKPFLWGQLAANTYSIKANLASSLWRQPKTSTIFDNLNEQTILNTIKSNPLNLKLNDTNLDLEAAESVYDLSFLLPLFAMLLAPENAVQTYKFTQSGAMSLTLLGLSSDDEEIRKSAGFVLARFYHHVEARHIGKDNFVWLRFVEAVCRGTTYFSDFKINHMASIFLAKMAMILTQPNHVMYVPLSRYLTAKAAPDFRSIPNFASLFKSADVFYKKHQHFILKVMKDGMRTKDDFKRVLEEIGFTSIMEHYTSVTVDGNPDITVLEIFKIATTMKYAVKLLCYNYSLISWLYLISVKLDRNQSEHLSVIFDIIENIVKLDDNRSLVLPVIQHFINSETSNLSRSNSVKLLRILCLIFDEKQTWFTSSLLKSLIDNVDNKECLYYLKYGMQGIEFDISTLKFEQNVDYYLKYLTMKFITAQNM